MWNDDMKENERDFSYEIPLCRKKYLITTKIQQRPII